MKLLPYYLLFNLLLLLSINASAQQQPAISGIVIDENSAPLKGATVFISGTEKITSTNDEGKFEFDNMDAGTFTLSAIMLGYAPYAESIIVKADDIKINIALKVKTITLNEVVIGGESNWESYYKLFKGQFLGTSRNAQECVILNPKVLSLNYNKKKGLLTAEANEFLLIENKLLGYKLRYMLKDFQYNAITNTAIYDGDINFEQMDGSTRQKNEWARNRLDTYKGSFMQFLRSVYNNTTQKEGFITYSMYKSYYKAGDADGVPMVSIDPRPMKFDTIVTAIDTSFIALKCSQLYITYDPRKNALIKASSASPEKKDIKLNDPKGSTIKLPFKEAIIDRKGSYTNYRAFFIHGNLASKRVGDQLPFEYQPPAR